MNNIYDSSNYTCSGCGACITQCSNKAITLELNRLGFFEARINENLCTNCGLCKKICTRYINEIKGFNLRQSTLFAAQSKDPNIVKKCSSGGIAHEIGLWALKNNYKICGAVYDLDTNTVIHKITDNIDELDGSKYLQSNTSIFKQVIEETKKGNKFVIFGTPCQIAGLALTADLNNIRNNLLLVEVFCHGVPTYKLWEKEIEQIKNKLNCKRFDDVQFRYKKNDWHSYCLKIDSNDKTYFGSREGDLFYRTYFDDVLMNKSCITCRLRKESSYADIRLGDCWGSRYSSRKDGVSAIYCNTTLAKTAIGECNLNILDSGTIDEQLSCQNMNGYNCLEINTQTMNILEKENIDSAIKYYKSKLSIKRKIKNIGLSVISVLPDSIKRSIKRSLK